jgi:hypothetical protein
MLEQSVSPENDRLIEAHGRPPMRARAVPTDEYPCNLMCFEQGSGKANRDCSAEFWSRPCLG